MLNLNRAVRSVMSGVSSMSTGGDLRHFITELYHLLKSESKKLSEKEIKERLGEGFPQSILKLKFINGRATPDESIVFKAKEKVEKLPGEVKKYNIYWLEDKWRNDLKNERSNIRKQVFSKITNILLRKALDLKVVLEDLQKEAYKVENSLYVDVFLEVVKSYSLTPCGNYRIRHEFQNKKNVFWLEPSNYQKIREEIQELKKGCFEKLDVEDSDYATCWIRPPPGMLKTNSDSSWKRNPHTKQYNGTTVGVVRDHLGNICNDFKHPIFVRQFGVCESSQKSECLSVLDNFMFMLLNKANSFIIESDAQDVIMGICDEHVQVDDHRLMITISLLLLLHEEAEACNVVFVWVDRSRNTVANSLARIGQEYEEGLHTFDEVPDVIAEGELKSVKELVENDATKWSESDLSLKKEKNLMAVKYAFRGKK